jgi:hypothetical protein
MEALKEDFKAYAIKKKTRLSYEEKIEFLTN